MPTHRRDRSLGDGIYYAPESYVGALPRLAVLVVDGFVLIVAGAVFAIAFAIVSESLLPFFWPTYLLGVWLYLAVLKPSKVRTLGYWVTGVQIVNLRGERPSIWRMTARELLWLFGPFNLLFDLIWCGIDDDRQSLRDRYTGTCVIKYGARPIGTGEIHLAIYAAAGYMLTYPRVTRPQRKPAESPELPVP